LAEAATLRTVDAGWLRSRSFDSIFVGVVPFVALLSGAIVIARPERFGWVLFADLWLLGYHHVVYTYTRLAFDTASLREHRFHVFVLPLIVFSLTFLLAWSVGIWVIASVYFYWQWFHYTRQSWGVSQVYRAKFGSSISESRIFSQLCFYLVPLWGILYRSWQSPDEFLFVELRVIPVPEMLVTGVGIAAMFFLLVWVYQRLCDLRAGKLPVAYTWYMLSHFSIFLVGYLLIDDVTYGWLVINIWHNAQYILFVWLFNTNRYKNGVDDKASFLSTLSQRENVLRYMLCCIGISTVLYMASYFATYNMLLAGVPMVVLIYQAINFHHYIVDSRIWKVRKKPMRETLALKTL
jgi:hypothetical protein